jgi:hypothetical protein
LTVSYLGQKLFGLLLSRIERKTHAAAKNGMQKRLAQSGSAVKNGITKMHKPEEKNETSIMQQNESRRVFSIVLIIVLY